MQPKKVEVRLGKSWSMFPYFEENNEQPVVFTRKKAGRCGIYRQLAPDCNSEIRIYDFPVCNIDH